MSNTSYKSVRQWLRQSLLFKYYQKLKSFRIEPKYFTSKSKQNEQRQKSIVFLCPSNDIPLGGVKVIYNQSALITSMKGLVKSSVLHPLNTEFCCSWFEHHATIKHDLEFSKVLDFVIIPEFWAVPHARLLHNIGVRYGIYVQNGYVISRNPGEELDAAYNNATFILAISNDTEECIKMAYPECAGRVHRVHYSVKSEKFTAQANKENIICYMPRKLQRHSQLVTFFLNKMIPPHWRIESIDGLDENGVAAILGRSRIFLSFSEFEGCPLPPVEAALSGCQVIGYTGEGAKEYWDSEIFTEINSGDIKAFVKAVLKKIVEIDNSTPIRHIPAITKLAARYSSQVELADMQFVSTKVAEILNSVDDN